MKKSKFIKKFTKQLSNAGVFDYKNTVGFYEPVKCNGKNCFDKSIKKGQYFWTVTLEDGSFYDCKTQFEAEVMSRLAEINYKLGKILKMKK